jgi:hypothetical protein
VGVICASRPCRYVTHRPVRNEIRVLLQVLKMCKVSGWSRRLHGVMGSRCSLFDE